MENVVLGAGYVLAVPVCVRLVPVMREQRVPWFVALQLGTALIVAGWLLKGERAPATVNAVFFVAFAAWWVAAGRRATAAA